MQRVYFLVEWFDVIAVDVIVIFAISWLELLPFPQISEIAERWRPFESAIVHK